MSTGLPEEAIAEAFIALQPQERKPKAFWDIAVATLPSLRTSLQPSPRTWSDIDDFLRSPWAYDLHFEGIDSPDAMPWRDAIKVAELALNRVQPRPIRARSSGVGDPIAQTAAQPRFCAFCWRLAASPASEIGFGPNGVGKNKLASPVRCHFHGTMKAHQGSASDTTAIRTGRARENTLYQRERELIAADKEHHQGRPHEQSQIRGSRIINSDDRTDWAGFVQETFPFVAYKKGFEDISLSPERAFDVLDGTDNLYPGRDRIHAALLSDKRKLSFYLMPMLLRADVWFEYELRSSLEKKHRARLKRLSKIGRGGCLLFRMPTRPEWAQKKRSEQERKTKGATGKPS